MTINQIYERQATQVINALGESVTYITQTGTQHSIKAVIDRLLDEYGNAVGQHKRSISVIRAYAPHIRRGEQIVTADKDAFVVEDVLDEDGFVITLSAARV